MTQQELKSKIEHNTLDDSPLVLVYTDNNFICKQYAKTIAKNRNLELIEINSLKELEISQQDDAIFDSNVKYLYLYITDELKETIAEEYRNLLVICKKIASKNELNNAIEIAPLINWQIEDYVKMRLPGLVETQIKWLCEITQYDIFRLDNECKKIEIFSTEYQKIIFDLINREDGYRDLVNLTTLDLINAVLKKDIKQIAGVVSKIEFIDMEPMGFVTIMRSQLKKIIDIQLNPKATPESLGMSSKQFAFIKYNSTGIFNQNQLLDMYEFITGIDFRLKNGDLQFNKNPKENSYNFIDYLITKLIILGSNQANTL